MSVKFYIRNPKEKNTPTRIFLVFYYLKKQIIIYTGDMIKPKDWNTKTRMADKNKTVPNWKAINENIILFRNRAENAQSIISDFNTKQELVDYLKGISNTTKQVKKTFLDFFTDVILIENIKKKAIYESLLAFSKRKYELSWEAVQKKQFAKDYRSYLENKGYKINDEKRQYTTNYIGRHFKVIKAALNSAHFDYELIESVNVRHLKVLSEDINNIYLNADELKAIHTLELKPFSKMDNVRDRFLIGCYTGLRFNDFINFDPDIHLIHDRTRIMITTGNQTGNKSTTVVLPIHHIVQSILDKRDYMLPKSISNQKMNDYLKILGKEAGLNKMVTIIRTEGGKRTINKQFKHDLITTHTARRSFATNAFIAGIEPILIMKLTGHKTEKSFMKYIKISADQAADLMAKNRFFSQQ